MSILRPSRIWVIAALAILVGCASGDIEEPNDVESNATDDVGTDDTGDSGEPDVEDTDTDPISPDPCDECEGQEVCIDDACVDLCAEHDRGCGLLEVDEYSIQCGDCSVGDCDAGVCPDVCDVFNAQCGDVYFDGDSHDCGGCSGFERCMHNQCTAGERFIDIAAGHSHTCGLRSGGEIRCWGENNVGQLGDGDLPENANYPVRVDNLFTAATLSSLNNHSCVVREDDHVYCWGANGSGRLGDGTTNDADEPVRASGVTASQVAAGGSHSCALLQDERVSCWGDNGQGQLATGVRLSNPSYDHDKERVIRTTGDDLDQVVQISLGSAYSCALRRDNGLWCWGQNSSGQLGRGDNHDAPPYAERLTSMEPIYRVATGFQHTCAIAVGGDVYCWGRGNDGELGDGNGAPSYSAVEVELPEPAIDVSTGRFHSCAVGASGDVYCWGRNNDGQIGQGTTGGNFEAPEKVDGVSDILRVAAGAAHSCALASSGDAYCWGANGAGQLGDESTDGSPTPVTVAQ